MHAGTNADTNANIELAEDDNIETSDNYIPFQQSSIWLSVSKQTDEDDRATDMLLSLRASEYYIQRFDDKATKKIILWQKISKELSERGMPRLADDSSGAKKCRQKFNNLVTAYQKFMAKRRQTGKKHCGQYLNKNMFTFVFIEQVILFQVKAECANLNFLPNCTT